MKGTPRRALGLAALALALALAITLTRLRVRARAPAEPVPPPGAASALEVELSACAAVLAGPICELPADGALRAWVSAPPGAVTFLTPTGRVRTTTTEALQGGTLHRLVVEGQASELRVVSPAGAVLRVLRLAARSAPPWVERARALRQSGDLEGAAALVVAAEASRENVDRAFAQGLRARLELAAGRTEASLPLFREAAQLHRALGRLSDAADDRFALAFALNQRKNEYSAARRALEEVHDDVAGYADGRAREAYYRGTLATETGDARSALGFLREARDHAARLGLALLERNAINAYALQLELVGRVREALAILAELEGRAASSPDVSACERVEIAINTGFGALLANEQREEGGEVLDAVAPLERAATLSELGCKDRYLRTAALGNLALAALERDDVAGARARLAQARAGVSEARGIEVLFWHELEGRIALAEGHAARALAAFEEEATRAHDVLSYEAEWRARVGKGTALERLARNDEALAEYRAAEELLTSLSLLVPLGEGRGTFVGDRGRSAKSAIELLVRRGRPQEALAVARSSRARVAAALAQRARLEGFAGEERARWEGALGSFRSARAALDREAKDDWKLPREDAARARASREGREAELRGALDAAFALLAGAGRARQDGLGLAPLPADAVTLAFHPLRRGWVGIVADRTGVTSFAIPALPPLGDGERLSEGLLAPLRARLEGATRLRILPFGPLRAVDFHALPYEGRPLVEKLAVEYPVDLPERSGPRPAGQRRALVVSDPSLDLGESRAEADHVVRRLRERGDYQVDVLEGPQATSAALLPLLAQASLLHYAGHGVFGGREGAQSALPLAGGGQLTIGDVLAASAVPGRLVLSGCETARTSKEAPVETLGLAQAFIVAGADFVIAPIRPVEDALAARLSTALYGALAEGGVIDSAGALREAQRRLRAEDPAVDWSAFRKVCR